MRVLQLKGVLNFAAELVCSFLDLPGKVTQVCGKSDSTTKFDHDMKSPWAGDVLQTFVARAAHASFSLLDEVRFGEMHGKYTSHNCRGQNHNTVNMK